MAASRAFSHSLRKEGLCSRAIIWQQTKMHAERKLSTVVCSEIRTECGYLSGLFIMLMKKHHYLMHVITAEKRHLFIAKSAMQTVDVVYPMIIY
jgi:hypothetical protein